MDTSNETQRPPAAPIESHVLAVQRAILPEVMAPPDVRAAFRLETDSAARRAILRGDAGPFIRRGRRLYVLRTSFLAHLEAQAGGQP